MRPFELAYWEAREREGSMGSEQQPVRSDISVIEQQSEARVLIRNRGLIALEILGDHELSRNCTDDSTPNPDAKSAVSLGSYYQLKEFLNSLVESQVNPETGLEREADLRQFGKEIAVRLNCMVQRFNAQSRFQGGSSETTPGRSAVRLVRLADDDLIRRIGPVSIFDADPRLLTADPVPVHRLALFLEAQARRSVEDRWYGEESRQKTGQPSSPYYERVAKPSCATSEHWEYSEAQCRVSTRRMVTFVWSAQTV